MPHVIVSNPIGVLTAIVLSISIIGGGVRAISKLTRIADAVERLTGSMEHVISQIGDHEKRIDRLEGGQGPASRPARSR
jgi:hypothetical protein